MMREVLFRGKRLNDEENEWAYGSYVKQYDCDMIYFLTAEIDGFDYAHIIPETLGQYTGLTDKNGKKIFDGDVIRGFMDYGPAGLIERIVSVSWHDKYGYQWNYFDTDTIEVIGNIHDTPELLKGGESDA